MLPIIAIDGPAASGKGTLSKRIAAHYGFAHLDTGSLYRAVGLSVIWAGGDPANPDMALAAAIALTPQSAILSHPGLRGDDAACAASKVAAMPAVRAALLDFQHEFVANPPGGKGSVLDGRDIGTVVCPDAPAKLFITASAEVRAERRVKELRGAGQDVSLDTVLADMRARDERDSQRAVAPLVAAPDAFLLDTSSLDANQAFEAACEVLRGRIGLA